MSNRYRIATLVTGRVNTQLIGSIFDKHMNRYPEDALYTGQIYSQVKEDFEVVNKSDNTLIN